MCYKCLGEYLTDQTQISWKANGPFETGTSQSVQASLNLYQSTTNIRQKMQQSYLVWAFLNEIFTDSSVWDDLYFFHFLS